MGVLLERQPDPTAPVEAMADRLQRALAVLGMLAVMAAGALYQIHQSRRGRRLALAV